MVSWVEIRGAICCEVSGKDARRYLHNRLSNDVRGLAVGSVVRAAALTAQGRVEALFSVVCEEDQRFLLVADGGDSDCIVAAVRKFVVADRVALSDLTSALALLHISDDSAALQADLRARVQGIVRIFPYHRLMASGIDVLVRREQLQELCAWCRERLGQPLSDVDYYSLRWEANLPVYPNEVNQEVILTECGMREAVSFSKGCYVGQEVIERSDAVGRLPRVLGRVEFTGSAKLPNGSQLTSGDNQSVGKIASSHVDPRRSRTLAFALIRVGLVKQGEVVLCNGLSGIVV